MAWLPLSFAEGRRQPVTFLRTLGTLGTDVGAAKCNTAPYVYIPLQEDGDHLLDAPFFERIASVLKADVGELLLVSDNLPYMKLCAETLESMRHADGTAMFSAFADGHRPVSHAPGVFHGTPSGFHAEGHGSSYFDRLWERRSKSRFYVAVRLNRVAAAKSEDGQPRRAKMGKRDRSKLAEHVPKEAQRPVEPPNGGESVKGNTARRKTKEPVGSRLKVRKTDTMKRKAVLKSAASPSGQTKPDAKVVEVGNVGRANKGK
jgi:hypothetical protein